MKSHVVCEKDILTQGSYYYFPSELVKNKDYINFSSETKLLVGILLSLTEDTNAIVEVANLINTLGTQKINEMAFNLKQVKQLRGDM